MARAEGRQEAVPSHAVPGCFPDSKGVFSCFLCLRTVELPARTLIFSFGSGVTFRPAERRQEAVPSRREGVFLIRRVSSGLLSLPWNSKIAPEP